jgi:hypothetical protein
MPTTYNVSTAAGLLTALAGVVTGDQINLQSGTPYVLTAPLVIPSGCATLTLQGYQTTPGEGGTKPLITTATDATDLITTRSTGGTLVFDNISFSNTAATRANCIVQLADGLSQHWAFRECLLDGFTTGIASDNQGAHYYVASTNVFQTEIRNCSAAGITVWGGTLFVYGSWLHGSLVNILSIGLTYIYCSRSIIADATSTTKGGIDASLNLNLLIVSECDFFNNAGGGVVTGTPGNGLFSSVNNIYSGNGLSGRNGPSLTALWQSEGDAYMGIATGTATANGTTTLARASGMVFDVSMVGKTVLYAGVNYTISAFTDSSHVVMPVAIPAHIAAPFSVNAIANGRGGATDIILSADPFTSAAAGDFSLNNTAGGGALLKGAAAQWGGTPGLDIGAIQSPGPKPGNVTY